MKFEKGYFVVLYGKIDRSPNGKLNLEMDIPEEIQKSRCFDTYYKSREDAENALKADGIIEIIEDQNAYGNTDYPSFRLDIAEEDFPVREDNDLGDGCYIDEDTGYLYNEDEDQYYDDDGVPVDPNDIF